MSRGQFQKANANLVHYTTLACSSSASDPLASAAIVNDLRNLQAMNAGLLGRASAARSTTAAYHLPMAQPPPNYPSPPPPPTAKSKAKASGGIVGFFRNWRSLVSGPSARSAFASASAAPVHLQQQGTLNALPEGEMDSVDAPGAAASATPAPMEDAANKEESTAIHQTIDDRSATSVYRAKKSSYI